MIGRNVYRYYSETLNQEIKIIDEGNSWLSVETADGSTYSPIEIKRFLITETEITKEVHELKKVFAGEIISIQPFTSKELYLAEKEKEWANEQTSKSVG